MIIAVTIMCSVTGSIILIGLGYVIRVNAQQGITINMKIDKSKIDASSGAMIAREESQHKMQTEKNTQERMLRY